jgi:dipeptidyl aminopeptidase/acylaminoacyl peptidase
MDAKGNVILQSVYDEEAKAWSLFANRSGDWREIQSESSVFESPYVVAMAPEDNTVIVKKYEDHSWILRRLSLTDGKWGAAIPEKCCGSSYLIDSRTLKLFGYSWLDARRHYEFLDKKDAAEWDKVIQSFPGEEVRLESWSDDRSKVIVRVFGKSTGAAYVLVDLANQQMSRVGNLYAGIEAADIAVVKPVSYTAADGMQITAYLTIPSRKETKNLPLIVLPHGGPAARDNLEFDWMAQAFASRGYLVLQPNFRGSDGLGQNFKEAGYGEYGRKMQTDLSDGVRALVKIGIADPKRVCIVGASYGGYAALTAATTEADIYRCIVSIAGVSDMKAQVELPISTSANTENRSVRYWLRYTGATSIKDPILVERSPAMHAARAASPILLIHGTNDAVVPFEQSEIMAAALKKANKPYEFVKLKSEDHWLSKADTRLQMLQAVVKFLETNNPP